MGHRSLTGPRVRSASAIRLSTETLSARQVIPSVDGACDIADRSGGKDTCACNDSLQLYAHVWKTLPISPLLPAYLGNKLPEAARGYYKIVIIGSLHRFSNLLAYRDLWSQCRRLCTCTSSDATIEVHSHGNPVRVPCRAIR